MLTDFLKISDKISVLPVIHGSGDYALEVRRVMLETAFDCVAVPLPPSFQSPVEEAITQLPAVTAVVQPEYSPLSWDRPEEDEGDLEASFVPVDPCQPVIAAVRI
ncbi:hypothetical protein OAE80_04280, partial [Planctomycetaceae bacterium]|nr:hypothetical protein [Planctomycetaceae bacterium]